MIKNIIIFSLIILSGILIYDNFDVSQKLEKKTQEYEWLSEITGELVKDGELEKFVPEKKNSADEFRVI